MPFSSKRVLVHAGAPAAGLAAAGNLDATAQKIAPRRHPIAIAAAEARTTTTRRLRPPVVAICIMEGD